MKALRRVVIAIVGGTILLVGIAMIILPVPSMILILAGLGILAIEFAWAKYFVDRLRQYLPGRKGVKLPLVPPVANGNQAPEVPTFPEK